MVRSRRPAPCSKTGHDHADTCRCDARWKWGYQGNYAHLDTAREWADKHPKLGGQAFILDEDGEESHAFVDGDDVRCPESGDVHPEFVAALERLGVTYADISVSGSGIHALYIGDPPSTGGDETSDVLTDGGRGDPPPE